MNNLPSILDNNPKIDLGNNRTDLAVSILKSLVGMAPRVGTALSEAITLTIPDQRLERIVTVIQILEHKVAYIDKNLISDKFKDPEFLRQLEEVLRQATRAVSRQRLEHLASVLEFGISSDEIDSAAQEKLLEIFDQLNDLQIVRLKYYWIRREFRDEYQKRHFEAMGGDNPGANPFSRLYTKEIEELDLLRWQDKGEGQFGELLLKMIGQWDDKCGVKDS